MQTETTQPTPSHLPKGTLTLDHCPQALITQGGYQTMQDVPRTLSYSN